MGNYHVSSPAHALFRFRGWCCCWWWWCRSIRIPHRFRCPISGELMEDPVLVRIFFPQCHICSNVLILFHASGNPHMRYTFHRNVVVSDFRTGSRWTYIRKIYGVRMVPTRAQNFTIDRSTIAVTVFDN